MTVDMFDEPLAFYRSDVKKYHFIIDQHQEKRVGLASANER
jgi:hypothetical protein